MRSAHTGLYRGAELDHVTSIEKGNLIEQFHFTSTIFDLKVIKAKNGKFLFAPLYKPLIWIILNYFTINSFLLSYPMVRYTDMDEVMKKEVMEVCTNACEKHTANNELVGNKLHQTQIRPWLF